MPGHGIPALVAATMVALGGCAMGGGQSPEPAGLPAGVSRVGPGAYVFESDTARSLFLVGRDGVIVTDPVSSAVARDYRAAIRSMTDLPVRYVVYSHNHWDRILGAEVFTAEGARVVAQERCAESFRANPNPAVVMPDISFRDRYTVRVAGAALELRYFGPSHGDCLTVFHARPAEVMQIVDLLDVARASFPADPLVPNLRPHNLRAFFAAAADYARLAGVTAVVASSTRNGGPVTGPAAAIRGQGDFWEQAFTVVEGAEARGAVGNDSIPRLTAAEVDAFRTYGGFNSGDLPFILRRLVAYEAMGR